MSNMPQEVRTEILNALKRLTPAELEEVIFCYGIDPSYLPQNTQAQRAIELCRHAENNDKLEDLDAAIKNCKNGVTTLLIPTPQEVDTKPDLDLLPYLVNRSEQDRALNELIASHSEWQKPLVCMIHGNDDDCPEDYSRRLKTYTLPRQLNTQAERGIAEVRCRCEFFDDEDTMHDDMRARLSNRLFDHSQADLEDIALAISQKAQPVIVWTDMTPSDLEECDDNAIHWYLNFWKNWPQVSAQNHLVLACLAFCYAPEPKAPKRFRLFGRKKPSINTLVQEKLNTLDFSNHAVLGAVLPQLKPLKRRHAELWQEDLCSMICDTNQLRRRIKKAFPEHTQMPLQQMADLLIEILQECSKKQGQSA